MLTQFLYTLHAAKLTLTVPEHGTLHEALSSGRTQQ